MHDIKRAQRVLFWVFPVAGKCQYCYYYYYPYLLIARHCNLRPPDVAPVFLGFNYEVRTSADKFNNFATFANL